MPTATACWLRSRASSVDCVGRACASRAARSPLSAIFIDARGERMIVTYRDERLDGAHAAPTRRRSSPTSTCCWPTTAFRISCADLPRGARARHPRRARCRQGRHSADDPLFADRLARDLLIGGLRATTGIADLGAALDRASPAASAASSRSPTVRDDVLWLDGGALRGEPVFAVEAVDTLGAGDVFHGGFALALAEGRDDGRRACGSPRPRPGSNARAFGGIAGAPTRAEVEALLP